MTVMNGADPEREDVIIPWCERFWFGKETFSVNLSGSEATLRLAAFAAKKNNNNAVTLVSTVFDPVSYGTKDEDSIQTNRTWAGEGTKNVTCILVTEKKVYKSYFFTSNREESLAANEQREESLTASKTIFNKTGDARVSDSSENSTIFLPAVFGNGTLTPTEMDISTVRTKVRPTDMYVTTITPIRPESGQDQHQTLILIISSLTMPVGTFMMMVIARYLVMKWRISRCHDDQNADDDSPNYCEISSSAVDPLARPVLSVRGWAMPIDTTVHVRDSAHVPDTHVGRALSPAAEEHVESHMPWTVPEDDYNINNPGYRHSSLPTDENPYWQIPDEYYGYENTARQANWRPSSLPLTLGVTYENVGQDETVERWQWQPSDLDAEDEDDDVFTFYAAEAEVALPAEIRSGTKHRHYENHVHMSKSLSYLRMAGEIEKAVGMAYGRQGKNTRLSKALRCLRETGEIEKKEGLIAYGRPTEQKSRDMVARGAYGTKPEYWKVASYGGRSVKSNTKNSPSYETEDRHDHASKSTGDVSKLYQESARVPRHRSWSQEMSSTVGTRKASLGKTTRRRFSV
ncbi:Hypp8684 [Branchiostoma lanceolatum]|uniref:Hypp8684 protein n=1 Tax=Branchiostoma lanceolatum TaxID=7740 RepID=A0A8J9ZA71_BRALA|nr:Hypp8684 [Branchiostoma lanceolatum]